MITDPHEMLTAESAPGSESAPNSESAPGGESAPVTEPTPDVAQALRHAAERATLAPSIHNTQPWRFVVGPDRLDIYAVPGRRAPVIDPAGRQLAISCGAALFGARAALAAAELDAVTTLLPDSAQPDWLATITVVGTASAADPDAVRLDAAAGARHSNRRQFGPDPVPDSVVETLVHAAEVEGAWVQPIHSEHDRVAVSVLSQQADALQNANPAYRGELREWTTDDPQRRDGVPASAVPHVTGVAHDDVPIRDFDTRGAGGLPGDTRSSANQTMVVLGTAGDGMRDWLITGQALGRVLLEVTSAGLVASILSQIVEAPTTRQQLREDLRLSGQPQLLIRVGAAGATPASARLPMSDVITPPLG